MSANLVANVTISGNTLVLAASSNVQYINAATSNIFTFAAGIATVNRFPAVGAGRYHTAILFTDGTVKTVGGNSQGQLGLDDTTNRVVPVTVPGIAGATAVAGAGRNTAVLLSDGTVRTFGLNSSGQLGVNDTTTRQTPAQVFGISSSAVAVSCGTFNTTVLLADGTVRTFGQNTYGQLGINVNDGTNRLTPVQVFGISSSATAISCGQYLIAVLLADGTVRTFGFNNAGQLGINVNGGSRQTPVQVFGISSSATAVSCGAQHMAVLLADGTVRTFGNNSAGELGINVTGGQRETPVQVFGISSSAVAVACSSNHTAVLLADGTVRTFGRNSEGQLGVNDTTSRQTPVQVFGISSSATAITCGQYHTAVLLADGTVRTFGFNGTGQLGLGDTASRLTPVQVVSALLYGGGVGKVAGGVQHTAVILADGTVRTFGSNSNGQLGVNDTTTRQTPVQVFAISSSATAVACGFNHTAVLLADGTVRTFGQNTFGALGDNTTTDRETPVPVFGISSSATAVACGYQHTVVLLANGTVRTFGQNSYGNLGINVNGGTRQTPVQVFGISSSAVAVEGGQYHTAVLLADGTVRTFGRNNFGQLGDNTATQRDAPVQVFGISSSATSIACGNYFTAVLLADGTVRTFGNNATGQLGDNTTTQRDAPVQVFGISSSAVAVACGARHTAVLLADGTVRTFGDNSKGQLGINQNGGNRVSPAQVFIISSSATAIACGYYHTAVLLADGTVRTFGNNIEGVLGINVNGGSRQTPVIVFNIFTGGSLASTTFLTGAALNGFTFNGPVFTTNLGLGRVPDISYQLDLSSDGARKLQSSTWTTGSDRRIKSDIQTANLARCAEIVDSLDLKYFEWLSAEHTDRHSLGWIAQDVLTFFPKSVSLTEAGTLALDSDQLVKVLWGALKHTLNEHFAPEVPETVPEVPVAPVATETVVESVATTEPVAEVTEVPVVSESLSEPVTEVTEPVAEVPEVTEVPAVPEVTEVPVATESLSVDPGTEASESLSENTVEVPEVPATSDADPGTEASEPVPEVPAVPEPVPE